MGRALTTPLQIARHLLAGKDPWYLFVEAPRKAGGFYRLVNQPRHVTANSADWQACAMKVDVPAESAEGDLSQGRITLSNISRVPMRAVELENELLEQEVTLYLQHQTTLATFVQALSWKQTCLRVEGDALSLSFILGHAAQTMRCPFEVYDRTRYPQLLPSGGISPIGSGRSV